jgi:amidohydrolase
MIDDGAMLGVDMVLALHVDAHSPVGVIRASEGPSSAGVDTFFGTITGKGGHGARPHDTVDPFYLIAHVVLALNGIISRRLDPFHPAVVSIGRIHGGDAPNVIPDQVDISGTIRFMQPDVRQQIHEEIRRAFEIARTLGGDYLLTFETGGMPMINDPRAVTLITQAAASMIGEENVLPQIASMGAEDFGCFTDLAPGAMFSLGARIEGDERQHHNPRFDIDERCLPLGAAILAEASLRFLRQARA